MNLGPGARVCAATARRYRCRRAATVNQRGLARRQARCCLARRRCRGAGPVPVPSTRHGRPPTIARRALSLPAPRGLCASIVRHPHVSPLGASRPPCRRYWRLCRQVRGAASAGASAGRSRAPPANTRGARTPRAATRSRTAWRGGLRSPQAWPGRHMTTARPVPVDRGAWCTSLGEEHVEGQLESSNRNGVWDPRCRTQY